MVENGKGKYPATQSDKQFGFYPDIDRKKGKDQKLYGGGGGALIPTSGWFPSLLEALEGGVNALSKKRHRKTENSASKNTG